MTAMQPQHIESVAVPIQGVRLEGDLVVPPVASGIVLFAHGSGSSRKSPRNRFVAEQLNRVGIGTLLFDLMTENEAIAEEATGHLRFDIEFLSERMLGATDWLKTQPAAKDKKLGYFGASTGAAAALVAGAQRPRDVAAIVSRGGRPDLAGDWLEHVRIPTLLIVGGNDVDVMRLNHHAYERLLGPKQLKSVPRAGHLFEEPGALVEVTALAAVWFDSYLASDEDLRRQRASSRPGRVLEQ